MTVSADAKVGCKASVIRGRTRRTGGSKSALGNCLTCIIGKMVAQTTIMSKQGPVDEQGFEIIEDRVENTQRPIRCVKGWDSDDK